MGAAAEAGETETQAAMEVAAERSGEENNNGLTARAKLRRGQGQPPCEHILGRRQS